MAPAAGCDRVEQLRSGSDSCSSTEGLGSTSSSPSPADLLVTDGRYRGLTSPGRGHQQDSTKSQHPVAGRVGAIRIFLGRRKKGAYLKATCAYPAGGAPKRTSVPRFGLRTDSWPILIGSWQDDAGKSDCSSRIPWILRRGASRLGLNRRARSRPKRSLQHLAVRQGGTLTVSWATGIDSRSSHTDGSQSAT